MYGEEIYITIGCFPPTQSVYLSPIMTTRTSSRQAAMKAKEAITSNTAEPNPKGAAGTKRKEPAEKAPERKKGKKGDSGPMEKNQDETDQKTDGPSREAKAATKDEPAGRTESVIKISHRNGV